jgi:2-oxoglutarate ferredoxin oxidoreductase subunit alpha
MVVLQAESEVAAINMIYGAAGCGKRVMTTSSSPGISLMQEGLSYMAGSELPCLVANINRGGPGLGTIQPGQGDYFQAVKGGGHGDYKLLVLAPYSVQEMVDFVKLGFELAEKYTNPVMILTDGAIGQMMEKVELFPQEERKVRYYPWATTGKPKDGERRYITSLHFEPEAFEKINRTIQAKYREMEKIEIRYQTMLTGDAEYILTGYGLGSRICMKSMELGRQKGYKIGLLRPQTLYPFPAKAFADLAPNLKGILDVELNAGQMVEDVRLAVEGKTRIEFYGRMGGAIPTPEEILEHFEKIFIK